MAGRHPACKTREEPKAPPGYVVQFFKTAPKVRHKTKQRTTRFRRNPLEQRIEFSLLHVRDGRAKSFAHIFSDTLSDSGTGVVSPNGCFYMVFRSSCLFLPRRFCAFLFSFVLLLSLTNFCTFAQFVSYLLKSYPLETHGKRLHFETVRFCSPLLSPICKKNVLIFTVLKKFLQGYLQTSSQSSRKLRSSI